MIFNLVYQAFKYDAFKNLLYNAFEMDIPVIRLHTEAKCEGLENPESRDAVVML